MSLRLVSENYNDQFLAFQPPAEEAPDQEAVSLIGKSPQETSFPSKLVYTITRPFFMAALYPLALPRWVLPAAPFIKAAICKEFLEDIGGEHVEIPSVDEGRLDAMVFNTDTYFEKQQAAFAKWKHEFAKPEMQELVANLEVNLEGDTLPSLMRLPPIQKISDTDIEGTVWCPGAGNSYPFNPQMAMASLSRGKNILLFNYQGVMDSIGTPYGRTTCLDALKATEWLKERLNCNNRQIVLLGTSMGSGPAAFVGSQLKGTHIILDRPVSRMREAFGERVSSELFGVSTLFEAIDTFYPYDNITMISRVSGNVLILQAEQDNMIPAEHTERLYQALCTSKSPDDPALFREKCFFVAFGTHSSKAQDGEYSWYVDGPTQERVSAFYANADRV